MNPNEFNKNTVNTTSVDIENDNSPNKNFSFKKIFKWLLIIVVLSLLGLFIIGVMVGGTERKIKKDLFFNGDEKAQKKYEEVDKVYEKSYNGDYQSCLNLDSEQKEFCLSLASKHTPDVKICDLMSKDFYPPEDIDSKENCYVNVALVSGDRSICEKVSPINKGRCLNLFSIREARHKVCGPLFQKNSKVTPEGCLDYVVSLKDKTKCDLLEPAYGPSYKDKCYKDIEK